MPSVTVRTETNRYIQYADGSEELYDHANDPDEWTNIASTPAAAATIETLSKHLPANNAQPRKQASKK